MKYNVGDKVRIKSIDWYILNKDKDGFVHCGDNVFDNYMSVFCGSVVTIGGVGLYGYDIIEDMHCRTWTDEMIEGLAEEETNDCKKCGLTRMSTRCLFMDNCPHNKQRNIIEIPKDYILKDENGNVINATKIAWEKKKKEYPKTYDECCEVLGYEPDEDEINCYQGHLIESFVKLLICRDAYWKIAGEEMGLGKPWEPDWNETSIKYCLERDFDAIDKNVSNHKGRTFAFPTVEMRYAFKENFDPDIEICKELL